MYKEIFSLKEMLDKSYIPYMFNRFDNGYQIRLNCDIDVVEHKYSYGSEDDLLEIMGALTIEELENDSVRGYLTADEVFKRFKYCYENGTDIYKEFEEKENE